MPSGRPAAAKRPPSNASATISATTAGRGAGRRKRWCRIVSIALPRISTPHIRRSPVVGVGCSSIPGVVDPTRTILSRTDSGSKVPSRTSTSGMMRNGPPPPGSDGGPRKLMSIESRSATGIVRPAAWRSPPDGAASMTRGRRVYRATTTTAKLGTCSSPTRSRSGRPRTTPSRAAVTFTIPSSRRASRTAPVGRTNRSNSCATPGRGSKAPAPWATTGVITVAARRSAADSSSSSARAASKSTARPISLGEAAWRTSTARA